MSDELSVVAVVRKDGLISVEVRKDGAIALHQEMYDPAEANEFRQMLQDNPQLNPFTVFVEWLKFHFPNGYATSRKERTQKVGQQLVN